MSIEWMMPFNHFILCHTLLLPSVFPSIRVFSSELALHIRWPKYEKFSFSISLSNEYSGLISFRIDWFGLLAVQGTLKRVFSSTTIRKHQFLGAQPSLWSYSHICTWVLEKTTALTIQTFVSKVMSLFFNTLSRFVTAFLLRSECLLVSWLHTTPASDFRAQEKGICHCFYLFSFSLPWSDRTGSHDLCFLNVEF